MHPDIDLSQFASTLRLKKESGKRFVFDPVRRKYVAFTPEEFVRQLLIRFLLDAKHYNLNRMAVEKTIDYLGMPRRFDLIVYDKAMNPFLLAECKSVDQALNLAVSEQASRYNRTFQVPYFLVTNGLEIRCCEMNYTDKSYIYLDDIPDYPKE